jgi:hypothetical protein
VPAGQLGPLGHLLAALGATQAYCPALLTHWSRSCSLDAQVPSLFGQSADPSGGGALVGTGGGVGAGFGGDGRRSASLVAETPAGSPEPSGTAPQPPSSAKATPNSNDFVRFHMLASPPWSPIWPRARRYAWWRVTVTKNRQRSKGRRALGVHFPSGGYRPIAFCDNPICARPGPGARKASTRFCGVAGVGLEAEVSRTPPFVLTQAVTKGNSACGKPGKSAPFQAAQCLVPKIVGGKRRSLTPKRRRVARSPASMARASVRRRRVTASHDLTVARSKSGIRSGPVRKFRNATLTDA